MKDNRCCTNCVYCEREYDFQGEYMVCANEESVEFDVEVFNDTVCPKWDGEQE